MRTPILRLCLVVLLLSQGLAVRAGDDPYFNGLHQWGLQRIGFLPPGEGTSAWDMEPGGHPVVVAVIDSGIDFFHPDLDRASIWRNPGEEVNGRDDDSNGYVDDLIGWNFIDHDNNPWDEAGHGTHISGVIAAARGNGEGIAGINPSAQIMPLKALNFLGRGRSVAIAEAIYYAVRNGARVINISFGGEHVSEIEKKAIDHAAARNVLIVASAGNDAADATDYGPAGLQNVITVGATDIDDRRAAWSNWGAVVDVAAPGTDILSLRARRTDINLIAGVPEYTPGSAFVGPEARYYRASGTSFSAPFVAGVASLLMAHRPDLTAEQVKRMILQSARDIETPGVDRYTGYGLVDARAALAAEPAFFVDAFITEVGVVEKEGQQYLRVSGRVDADAFDSAWIEIGPGEDPQDWKKVSRTLDSPVQEGTLDDLEVQHLQGAQQWTIRLITVHRNGQRREARFVLNLG